MKKKFMEIKNITNVLFQNENNNYKLYKSSNVIQTKMKSYRDSPSSIVQLYKEATTASEIHAK